MTDPSPPADEFERRLKWKLLPSLSFMAFMVLLLAMAIVSLTLRPVHPHGLPEDSDARAAAAVLGGRVSVSTGALRWRASVLGGEPGSRAPSGLMLGLIAISRPGLEAAHRRHRNDPRSIAALAALDMATHRYAIAAGRYRRACELAPHYGEARLGAGVALALVADQTPELWPARALRLQAVAQFAMVDSVDAEYPLALYNRALTLREVGRTKESQFWASRYFALDDTSARAAALRVGLSGP